MIRKFTISCLIVFAAMANTALGATVPAAPSGPTAPAGGWAVVYGDAFGSCLADAATHCTAGYPRSDNTLAPASHANGAGNSNEIAGLVPAAVDVRAGGLYLHCNPASVTPNPYGNPDTCGAVTGGAAYSSPSPGAFNYTPGGSRRFVVQASFQAPPNQGNMDPSFWSNGPNDIPEIDIPELWGMNHPVPTGATNTWAGYQFGFPAVLHNGTANGNVQLTFGKAPVAALDPSRGQDLWTEDINGSTFTSYIDGVRVGGETKSPFNATAAAFKLLLMASMRKDTQTGKNYALPVGGNDLIFRYVAVYAPAAQGTSGTAHAGLVPGTAVG